MEDPEDADLGPLEAGERLPSAPPLPLPLLVTDFFAERRPALRLP